MTSLTPILASVFSAECISLKSGAHEKGIKFSIDKSKQDEVIRISLDSLKEHRRDVQNEGEKIADFIFIYHTRADNCFRVIIVELEGSDVEHGLHQLVETCQRFCANGRFKALTHAPSIREWSRTDNDRNHLKKVLALLVSRRGIPRNDVTLKKLQKRNPSLLIKHRKPGSYESGALFESR